LLATDLSKRMSDHGGNVSSVINRSFDSTLMRDPRVTAGRQFCITDNGYIGLVPLLSKVGDTVVILYGSKTPHVLRKHWFTAATGQRMLDKTYQLVGEGYFHGLMFDNTELHRSQPSESFALI